MEKALFDPGFYNCMLGVSDNVEFMYSAFVSSVGSLKQKRFQFSVLYPKIQSMLKTNIGFYLGCLLWAACLKNSKNTEILDNPCLNQEYDNAAVLSNVDYLVDFVNEKLNKDAKYYLNKTYSPDLRYIKILQTYKEFFALNKGFTKTEKTGDILLPANIKPVNEKSLIAIEEKIKETVDAKNLALLYDVYDLILE